MLGLLSTLCICVFNINIFAECFPPGHILRSSFNANTVKVSYRSMTNMAQVISKHNARVIVTSNNNQRGLQLRNQAGLSDAWRMPDQRSRLQIHHHQEGPVWLQPNQQSLPPLPPGKLPHHVLTWSSHLEQQEGDFFQLSPQKKADLDGKEAEMNPHNNFVFGPETLCWSSF